MFGRRPPRTLLTHGKIWTAIDALARRYGLSPSGLAKRAGLDATSFNRSKRITGEGRPRWPTTESIAKVLAATGASFEDFVALVGAERRGNRKGAQPIPLIGLTQAGGGGFFDDGGFPVGGGWDQIRFPKVDDENAYALEVTGDSMQKSKELRLPAALRAVAKFRKRFAIELLLKRAILSA
jgi:phage repressor protein C with HTH and peptisase S24 domain